MPLLGWSGEVAFQHAGKRNRLITSHRRSLHTLGGS